MEKKTDSIIKFNPRRAFGSLFAATAVAALMVPGLAFAADTNTGISADDAKNQAIDWKDATSSTPTNQGDTQYWLQLNADNLNKISIDVPVRVVLAVNPDGEFVTPTALKNVIENNSEFPVNVKAISITPKDNFTVKAANGFDSLTDSNIFNGAVKSVTLATDGEGNTTVTPKQSVAFTKLGTYTPNTAWAMQASDTNGAAAPDRAGADCLFIQIEGDIANVSGHYFTAPINVFDLTYTFEASPATDVLTTGTTSLATTHADITD